MLKIMLPLEKNSIVSNANNRAKIDKDADHNDNETNIISSGG